MVAVLSAKDVPGVDCYGVIPRFADQPVFAHREARFRGEGVAAVVGEPDALEALDLARFPVRWEELLPIRTIDEALAADAEQIHARREGNILVRGRVVRGDVEKALAEADVVVEGEYETGFVEHAYIEPEAGFARRVGDQIEIQACTQSPYMDRADIAKILGIAPETGANYSYSGWGRVWVEARFICAAVRCIGGMEVGASSAHGVFPDRVDRVDHEAASGTHATAGRGHAEKAN